MKLWDVAAQNYRQRKSTLDNDAAAAAALDSVNGDGVNGDGAAATSATTTTTTTSTNDSVDENETYASDFKQLVGHAGAVYGVALSPDNKWLLSSSADCTVRVFCCCFFSLVFG